LKEQKVLFLCTGNSCRSQMAEAIVNNTFQNGWQAFSAGTHPVGYVHPKALQVLDEIGIQHKGHSKSIDEFQNKSIELIVTVCDSAAEECPIWLGDGRVIHHSFLDPAKAIGSIDEILNVFRQVRDKIIEEIPLVLADNSVRN
jgi:arsenate reductase